MKFELEKFKQSNVARIFLAYAVVAFGMMQIFDYLLPIIEAPLWVAQTLTLFLFLGFPISLLVGWVTQRPIIAAEASSEASDLGFVNNMSRQKIILIGLGSSVIFGFLGFISMPYLLDQASFNRTAPDDQRLLQSKQNYTAFRASVNLGTTGIRGLHNTRTDIAISKDGMSLAFLRHDTGGNAELFMKDLGVPNSVRSMGSLVNGGGSGLLFFSQDGNWLHFISGGNLTRVRVEGGAFQTINSNVSVLRSGYTTYGSDTIFSDVADNQLYKIPASGGKPTLLTTPTANEDAKVFSWPSYLPNSNNILVTVSDNEQNIGIGRIDLYNMDTGKLTTIIETASNARYVESGHIVFVRDSSLWAVPFDMNRLEKTGLEVPVIQDVETNSSFGHATYSVSSQGRLVYLPGEDGASTTSSSQLGWVSREGVKGSVIFDGRQYGHISLSPNGDEISATVYDPNGGSDIWVWDLDRNTLGRRTFEGKASRSIWSSDGSRLIYSFGNEGLRSVASDGTEPPRTEMVTAGQAKPTSVSANGDIIYDTGSPRKIYRIPSDLNYDSETTAIELELAPLYNRNPLAQVSPDGNWIVYTSVESGTQEVYVRPYPNIVGGKWQVSVEPGFQAIWDESGSELFYWALNNKQYSVPYTIGEAQVDGRPILIEFGVPEELFQIAGFRNFQTVPAWDYSLERDSFLMLEREGGLLSESVSSLTNLVVVENWFEELRSLAPEDVD